jgi:hypothetical protein
MRIFSSFAVALVATFAFAAPAFAETKEAPAAAHAPRGEAGARHGERAEHGKKFPMAGAEFKQNVEKRIATARQHLESRIGSLPADKQKEARDKFNAGVSAVNAEVGRAVADNVVTKEEAKKVRELARSLRGGHGHGHHQKPSEKK